MRRKRQLWNNKMIWNTKEKKMQKIESFLKKIWRNPKKNQMKQKNL